MTPLEWTVEKIIDLAKLGYTGKIEINFNQGGITGINFNQSLKPMMDVRLIPMGAEIHTK